MIYDSDDSPRHTTAGKYSKHFYKDETPTEDTETPNNPADQSQDGEIRQTVDDALFARLFGPKRKVSDSQSQKTKKQSSSG